MTGWRINLRFRWVDLGGQFFSWGGRDGPTWADTTIGIYLHSELPLRAAWDGLEFL